MRRDRIASLSGAVTVPTTSALALEAPVGAGLADSLAVTRSDQADGAITLALVGGPRLLREATASLLGGQHGLNVTATYESAAHFLAVGADTPPAVLLLDCDGLDAESWRGTIAALSSAEIESRIVLLCREMREDAVRFAIEYALGGLILKSYSTSGVRAAIEYMATGRTVLPAGWQRVAARASGAATALSPRQRQILALIAEGRGNEQIAAELGVSANTIKFHVRTLYSRLGVHNRIEAANRYAQMSRGEA
jgi:two-component system nitrate/nitrite response regulator NarL